MVVGSFVVIYPSGYKDPNPTILGGPQVESSSTDSPLWDLDVFCITVIHWGPMLLPLLVALSVSVEPLGWCFTDFTCPAPEDVLCCICVNRHRLHWILKGKLR